MRKWLPLILLATPLSVFAQANDSFSLAGDISPAGGTLTGSTATSTAQVGEVGISRYAYGKSVWMRLVTPTNLRFNAKTEGSAFDTTLALYRGANISEARLVAGNDDDSGTVLWSQIDVNIGAGTYWLAVDGFSGANGNFALAWQTLTSATAVAVPANDNFLSPVALTLGEGGTLTTLNNQAATLEPTEPGLGQRSAWYRFVAPRSERLRVRTLDSQFDSHLEVYTGSGLGALTLVEINDDVEFTGSNLESEVTFDATAGVAYNIRLAARSNSYGTTKLVLAPAKVSGLPNLDGAYGGTWWNPGRDGEGVLIEIADHPDVNSNDLFLFFTWYTYDPSGNPVYLVGGATRSVVEATGTNIVVPVVTTRGARFGAAFNSASVIRDPWGSVTLRFASCGRLELTYTPTVSGWGAANTIIMERILSRAPGLNCP